MGGATGGFDQWYYESTNTRRLPIVCRAVGTQPQVRTSFMYKPSTLIPGNTNIFSNSLRISNVTYNYSDQLNVLCLDTHSASALRQTEFSNLQV